MNVQMPRGRWVIGGEKMRNESETAWPGVIKLVIVREEPHVPTAQEIYGE